MKFSVMNSRGEVNVYLNSATAHLSFRFVCSFPTYALRLGMTLFVTSKSTLCKEEHSNSNEDKIAQYPLSEVRPLYKINSEIKTLVERYLEQCVPYRKVK